MSAIEDRNYVQHIGNLLSELMLSPSDEFRLQLKKIELVSSPKNIEHSPDSEKKKNRRKLRT